MMEDLIKEAIKFNESTQTNSTEERPKNYEFHADVRQPG